MVSVIIPNYNHSKYLKQRINSVLNQTIKDIELIILDDCSTDESRNIINDYNSDPKVSHIVFNDSNSGSTFIQWKKGFELAKGEYIWIAESDDFVDTNFLSSVLMSFSSNPSITTVYTGSHLVDESGKILDKDLDALDKRKTGYVVMDGKTFVHKKMLLRNSIYNASAVVFKRTVISNVDMNVISQYKLCGDWVFWITILRQGYVCHIYDKLNYFRQHSQKVTPKSVREGVDISEGLNVLQKMDEFYELHFLRKHMVAGFYFYRIIVSKLDKKLKKKLWKLWHIHYEPYTSLFVFFVTYSPFSLYHRIRLCFKF